MSGPVTVGELDRRLSRFEEEVRNNFRNLDNRLTETLREILATMVRRDTYEDRHKVLQEKVEELEERLDGDEFTVKTRADGRTNFHRNLIIAIVTGIFVTLAAVIAAAATLIVHFA